ncbi:TPA: hypothetical protein ACH3X1_004158 [Trebouxia sp. C0004]
MVEVPTVVLLHCCVDTLGQQLTATSGAQVGVWQAVLGYTLASSCGLLWCIEGVVNNALHGDTYSGLLRNPKVATSAWDDPEFVEAVLRLVLSRLVDSQLGVFAMLNFAISIYAVGALTTKTIFLGKLTRLESSHMRERLLKFLAFKVVMVVAVWSAALEDSPFWLPMISYLAYIKVFVGLARDRLNGLLASPSATSVAHVRALALLAWIVTDNATWVMLHFAAFPGSDLTYRLLWLFDAVVITVEAVQTATIYGIQMYDRWRVQRAQVKRGVPAHPWEAKGGLLYHIDLGLDLVIRMLSMAHVFHVWWLHGLTYKPMDAVLFLDIRSLVFAIHGKIRTYTHYCSATYNLQHNFPTVVPSQLQSAEEECAICKEHMKTAKVLPCGHMYHLGCLRDWLQQSGTDNFTCPICRTPLFVKKQPLPGNRQGGFQRLPRWLTSFWRPPPYTYLDQSSAAVADSHSQQPVTSAFHVTEESAVDLHHFQPDSTAVTHSHMDANLRHDHVVGSELHDKHVPGEWHHDRNQGAVVYNRLPFSDEQQQAQWQHDVGQSSSTQEAATGLNRKRGPSTSRWQWGKRLWGSQPKRSSGAEASQRNERQKKRSRASQKEVLRNVKAVVPYLSDDVILAELDCTLDANQAVENLLSRM